CRERHSGRIAMSVQGFANEAANLPKLVDINARFAPSRNVNVAPRGVGHRSRRLDGFFLRDRDLDDPVARLEHGRPGGTPVRSRTVVPGLALREQPASASHLMPLIMVGQNLQDRYGELVANADFDISQRTEAE